VKIRSLELLVKRYGGDGLYRHFLRAVSGLIFRSGFDADSLFWNYGYAPLAADLDLQQRLKADATHAMLYHALIGAAWKGAEEPDLIVDVSAGRGGGAMLLAARFPNSLVVATDIDEGAMRRLAESDPPDNVVTVVCGGDALPVGPESTGLMLAEETLHHFEFEDFLAACRKGLRPGGVLAIAGTSIRSPGEIEERYRAAGERHGFSVEVADVTAHVLKAIETEPTHISRRVARFRWPLRRLAKEIFIAAGSERHRELRSGARHYYFACLSKPS